VKSEEMHTMVSEAAFRHFASRETYALRLPSCQHRSAPIVERIKEGGQMAEVSQNQKIAKGNLRYYLLNK
jgi:hypothetical protein